MTGGIRVLVYCGTKDVDGIVAAYHQASGSLAGVPGLLGNELLRSVHDPLGFVVASSWHSAEEFAAWEQGVDHKGQTAPLRPFQDNRMRSSFGIYQVMAQYPE
ncbi:antibiotic biosynthesis monooxygenase family protein [Amycolatopsis sp. lyj-90]|uniref:antibiotic biosynthesis monooxygenase family protein n=1 Tax=Amycolatopsis sp. lyj-90 TaxID=2789285 RepID=UPI00397DA65A